MRPANACDGRLLLPKLNVVGSNPISRSRKANSFLPTSGPQKITVASERDDFPERRFDLRLRDRAVALGHLLGEVAADAALTSRSTAACRARSWKVRRIAFGVTFLPRERCCHAKPPGAGFIPGDFAPSLAHWQASSITTRS